MNDLTKEELKILRDSLLWRDAGRPPSLEQERLKKRLHFMIKNYREECEHESEESEFELVDVRHPKAKFEAGTKCKKCGEFYL